MIRNNVHKIYTSVFLMCVIVLYPNLFANAALDDLQVTRISDDVLKNLHNVSNQQSYVSDEVWVKFKSNHIDLEKGSGNIIRRKAFSFFEQLREEDQINSSNVVVYKIKDDKTVSEKITELEEDASVEYAQPNYI